MHTAQAAIKNIAFWRYEKMLEDADVAHPLCGAWLAARLQAFARHGVA